MKIYLNNLNLLEIENSEIDRYPKIELENVEHFALSILDSDKLRYSYKISYVHTLVEVDLGVHTKAEFVDFLCDGYDSNDDDSSICFI